MSTIYETATGKIIMSRALTEEQASRVLNSRPGLALLDFIVPNAAFMRINRVTLQAEEIPPQINAVEYVREQRAYLLANSDWTQVSDNPLSESQREAWRAYRQALRDMTDDLDPDLPITEIEWPAQP